MPSSSEAPPAPASAAASPAPTVLELVEPLYEEIRKLKWLLHHDVLTGLPNEMAFQRRLVELEAGGHLLLVDLDGFKEYQDRVRSHRAGDRLLCAFARHLRAVAEALGAAGVLYARLHGDEFMLWAPDEELARALRARIEAFAQQGVTATVGIGPTLDAADFDMYRRKAVKKQRRFQQRAAGAAGQEA